MAGQSDGAASCLAGSLNTEADPLIEHSRTRIPDSNNTTSMLKKSARAPSGRLTRLRPVEQDPLSEYGLPSKGEKRLLSHKVQESYYALIVSRYLAFCTAAGDRDSLQRQFARHALSASTTTPSPALPPPTTTSSTPAATTPSSSAPRPPRPPGPSSSSTTNHPPKTTSQQPHPDRDGHKPRDQDNKKETCDKQSANLDAILAALRKLREGLVASRRHDHFAAQVFLFSARAGILAAAYETYYPALAHLVRWHGRAGRRRRGGSASAVASTRAAAAAVAGGGGGGGGGGNAGARSGGVSGPGTAAGAREGGRRAGIGKDSSATATTTATTGGPGGGGSSSGGGGSGDLTSVELNEVVGYLVLDAACRRGDLAEAYALRSRHGLADAEVDLVLRALVGDNWVVWRRVRRQVDGYRARLMEYAERRVTGHTLKAFGRAYLSLPLGVLEEQTARDWAELTKEFGVGWELDAGKVTIRKIPSRA